MCLSPNTRRRLKKFTATSATVVVPKDIAAPETKAYLSSMDLGHEF